MIAVIFEVEPVEGKAQEYFDLAVELKPHLEEVDGFISIERFESLSSKGKYLSLSFWRDEEAVRNWRSFEQHREAQLKGRNHIFADYRIRIASVVRDYGMNQRSEAPPPLDPSTVLGP
jgi:heme-degrading monooxygenase HmoA